MSELRKDLEYLAVEAGESPRQRLARLAHDFYLGEQLRYVERNPDETPEEFSKRPKAMLNVTRLVVDVLSGLYKDPPLRRALVPGGPGGPGGSDGREDAALSARLEDVWYANNIDGFMLAVDRCVRATGTAAVRVYYDPDHRGEGEGEIVYWFYPSQMLSGIADPERPWRPLGLVIRWSAQDVRGRAENRAEIWTAERYGEVRGSEVRWEANRLGEIPVVLVRDEPAQGVIGRLGTNLFPRGRGWEVAGANRVLNTRLSDDLWTLKMQGFGVPVLLNPPPDVQERFVLSPGRALAFGGEPEQEAGLSFAAPGAPLADLRADVAERIRQILLANRIPEDAIAARLVGGASGIAIRSTQIPIEIDRDERRRVFERAERELFDLTLRALNAHEPDTALDEGSWLEIEYPEGKRSGTPPLPRDEDGNDEESAGDEGAEREPEESAGDEGARRESDA